MKVILSRCNNDIEYVYDCLGYVIGFNEDYEDDEGNLYKLYYEAILEGYDLIEMLDNDCWEYVADWDSPTDIAYYAEYDDTIAKAITKKANGKHIGYGDSLFDIGCRVKVAKQGQQVILDI